MKNRLLISLLALGLLFSVTGYSSDEKVDWGICKADLESTGCTAKHDDHEKHECLEKAPKGKVSKACKNHNHKLEGKFSKKHHKGHEH